MTVRVFDVLLASCSKLYFFPCVGLCQLLISEFNFVNTFVILPLFLSVLLFGNKIFYCHPLHCDLIVSFLCLQIFQVSLARHLNLVTCLDCAGEF